MIAIIDYGAGNIKSLQFTLSQLNLENTLTQDEALIRNSQAIILPGVGSFQDAMKELKRAGLDKIIREEASTGKPILGICLGMQLFYQTSNEGGHSDGLGLLEGNIERIPSSVKVPHMGWNTLQLRKGNDITMNLPDNAYVYFVHSYFANKVDGNDVIGSCTYGTKIPVLVQKDNIIGMQFHPEKSSEVGLQLLNNFKEMYL
ncbi:imidazole glycerol phosphate synthase subunit HisH [Ornithinibacillus sp. BX22]|uniref:Imidazole glycerol phosphate synthase subunit HisH n=1 Tax=Ornithinibacillus hominis TaxID=2763055 RepID=A0A923L5L8_9BACI|nr:imidazole glycerol phosphate synthase subunit HisH [Ornithinibacillus hominis]MBC5636912.1 imidazole glycerol phosphate synthase subunit HisH [Ornithinibacillus hominis]